MVNMSEQIHTLYSIFREHSTISTDSRMITPGSIFFALKGDKHDGNRFARNAIENGASVSVVDDPLLEGEKGMFFVNDVLKALQDLAHFHRQQIMASFIAVTGSNGKTTTKELITAILSQEYITQSTVGNLNNHIGVPLTLLSLKHDAEFCIVEMGANHIGEISRLCQVADPDYGLITNIGKAHLEGFGGFEGVIRAKSELYDYLRAKRGKAFINYDNELLLSMAKNIEHISYGKDQSSYCSGSMLKQFPTVSLEINCIENQFRVDSNLAGDYNFENILAATCVGLYFNVKPSSIAHAIGSCLPDNFRSQLIETADNLLIMDAYNANPTSMIAAIENFASGPYQNKLLILGEMLELGDESPDEHIALVDFIKRRNSIRDFILIGQNFSVVDPKPDLYFESTDQFLEYLSRNAIQNKTILIKGSRGNQLERLIKLL
jgi:UDP-N-acetylmuramoyl-tripeptide--D-alanyl-D-alanine ligase